MTLSCLRFATVASVVLTIVLKPVDFVRSGEFAVLSDSNWAQFAPSGKESDAILGDYVIRNDRVWAVIAQPNAKRNANMTVRDVGAAIIDFTERQSPNDQLSAYYPAASQYAWHDAKLVSVEIDGKPLPDLSKPVVGKVIQWQVTSTQSAAKNGTVATVTYTLVDGSPWIDVNIKITNPTNAATTLRRQDSLRADGEFALSLSPTKNSAFATDRFFRQAYCFHSPDYEIQLGTKNPKTLDYVTSDADSKLEIPAKGTVEWSTRLSCAASEITLRSRDAETPDSQLSDATINVTGSLGAIEGAAVSLLRDGTQIGQSNTNELGALQLELPTGEYQLKVDAIGYSSQEFELSVNEQKQAFKKEIDLGTPSLFRATVTEKNGGPIPCKVIFFGRQGTSDPNFGPKSASGSVGNLVYSANGQITRTLAAGDYEVWFCRGPEYDVEQFTIHVAADEPTELQIELNHSVDTTGWISSDFHSHSSPSGDNTSSQEGRVLNLLAENIEFAPCTEHNRIDSYVPILESLRAGQWMATCTGIELTGSPLPTNHQNAFPLHQHIHEQDGGGPTTLADPVAQIERLAMWDVNSDKLVQSNHPDIHQMLGDRDLDDSADEGFRKMFGFMDVIEVHPPDGIFRFPTAKMSPQDRNLNPIFCWLQMLNLGYRIPGVVNTDAHYNFHGSGWLRNYMECSTDDPAKIDVMEMVHVTEHGHIVMSTGPFMQVELRDADSSRRAAPGDDWITSTEQTTNLFIRIQCPNWLDINRVQVFANGRPLENFGWTRRDHADRFGNGVVKFESEITLPKFEIDTHLIVATMGEGLELGAVMGPEFGKQIPAAVSNPIFVDVDGKGFQANRDDLGVPLPGKIEDLVPASSSAR
jgi:hypothetical protein